MQKLNIFQYEGYKQKLVKFELWLQIEKLIKISPINNKKCPNKED